MEDVAITTDTKQYTKEGSLSYRVTFNDKDFKIEYTKFHTTTKLY